MDPYLWLMDPTPFFSDFKDAKNYFFHIFSYNLPASTLSSVLNVFIICQNFVLNFYFASIISVRPTPLWEKERIRIRSWIRSSDLWIWIWIREAQKHADPDPQHWYKGEDKSNDIKKRGYLYSCLFLVMANQSNQLRLPAVEAKFPDLVPRIGE